ncbi:tetraacyldisaccharide 4'-kinase [Arenicella xantha]|uniref:tetraacyldisaccharide 4'-kinase n=1 Tax=Arenicella xantha TaxID=644221 RepID=UPI001FE2B3D3|nr:tetraacyldisaccharide 4'-kinase [Arenicella xantha]
MTVLLWPLSVLYRVLFAANRCLYQCGLKSVYRAPVPVIVVGNVSVGGTGKTPLVIYLVELLTAQGFKPGVISRGYHSQAHAGPLLVSPQTPVQQAGDEPALIVRRTGVPLCIDSNRKAAIECLLDNHDINVVISDDGLQHFALQRDIEICLLDQTSPMLNEHLLPAGPFREPLMRASSCDIVVHHGGSEEQGITMQLEATSPSPLVTATSAEGAEFNASQPFVAVAGIGNPDRFFNTCREYGFTFESKPFPDHHQFSKSDIDFGDRIVLMTEKDAVKCQEFADARHWYLPVSAKLSTGFDEQVIALLTKVVS